MKCLPASDKDIYDENMVVNPFILINPLMLAFTISSASLTALMPYGYVVKPSNIVISRDGFLYVVKHGNLVVRRHSCL